MPNIIPSTLNIWDTIHSIFLVGKRSIFDLRKTRKSQISVAGTSEFQQKNRRDKSSDNLKVFESVNSLEEDINILAKHLNEYVEK